ncbi:NAD(P)H-hydrate dehydratase [Rhizobium sp. FKY42]|uniref:NAD(P)H-hydrate dehydratase n=1 Tax=Rhizobium sp. FKY42 TaxID=2562310 RepID=UPI0010BF8EBE|nr:NAD(P)H-hydrate dehydratase [Rhizobium sp. FKY42]
MLRDETILFTTQEAAAADIASAQSGIDIADLMERAGYAVAASALRHFPEARKIAILCGPGNNGGDGYVAARVLAGHGCNVAVFSWGSPAIEGPARAAQARCLLPIDPISAYVPERGDLVIDALFGAGLTRPLPEPVQNLIEAVKRADVSVLAVDLPSGICGNQGRIRGAAFAADITVTFEARKPGHLLMPGRAFCGTVEVEPIGMPRRIVEQHTQSVWVNSPKAWQNEYPLIEADTHKYRRGHLAVFSGGRSHTGAARLAAAAGLHAGAGLVTVGVSPDALDVAAASLTAVMVRSVSSRSDVEQWLSVARIHACVIGPGFGVGETIRAYIEVLAAKPCIIDADAITSFASNPDQLFATFKKTGSSYILTPHEGEFARLFPDLAQNDSMGKLERARLAAARSGAVVIDKGPDTVIASPDGRCLINENAPPWLATAGSGDVLAGIAGAHLAQGMPAYEAAAAAVWLHAQAAQNARRGMTAEDLVTAIPSAVDRLNLL